MTTDFESWDILATKDGSVHQDNKRIWQQRLLRILLGFVALGSCYYVVDFGQSAALVRNADLSFIGITVLVLMPTGYLLKALKWVRFVWRIDRGNRVAKVLSSYFLGILTGVATPGRVGELARMAGLRGSKKELVVATFVDRVIELYSVVVYAGCGAVYLVTGSLYASLGVFIFSVICVSAVVRTGDTIDMSLSRKFGKVEKTFLAAYTPRLVVSQLMLALLAYGVVLLQFATLFLSFSATPWEVLPLVPLVMLTNLIPLTIGGYGIREWAFLLVSQGKAIDGSVIVNTSVVWMTSGLGVVASLWLLTRFGGVLILNCRVKGGHRLEK